MRRRLYLLWYCYFEDEDVSSDTWSTNIEEGVFTDIFIVVSLYLPSIESWSFPSVSVVVWSLNNFRDFVSSIYLNLFLLLHLQGPGSCVSRFNFIHLRLVLLTVSGYISLWRCFKTLCSFYFSYRIFEGPSPKPLVNVFRGRHSK